MSCLNVYGRKRGLFSHSLDCLLSVFFDDYMSKLFPIFYLAIGILHAYSDCKLFIRGDQTTFFLSIAKSSATNAHKI